jgi:hypothetical protein
MAKDELLCSFVLGPWDAQVHWCKAEAELIEVEDCKYTRRHMTGPDQRCVLFYAPDTVDDHFAISHVFAAYSVQRRAIERLGNAEQTV